MNQVLLPLQEKSSPKIAALATANLVLNRESVNMAFQRKEYMRFDVPSDIVSLAAYLPSFLAIVGEVRWFKRAQQLDTEQRSSPFLWKIVRDYHWLEMAISYQSDVLSNEDHIPQDIADPLDFAALRFVAGVVEVHARLSERGQSQLEGRLRDGLKAESGLASLYLEIDLALRILSEGYDVDFPDMEGVAQHDLKFSQAGFVGEIECKSLSADAGRRIHRKDFYRFMEGLAPALVAFGKHERPEFLVITLKDRLLPDVSKQSRLRCAAVDLLGDKAPSAYSQHEFRMERRLYSECLDNTPTNDPRAFYEACVKAFGPTPHIAGGLAETGGCFVVMRSEREDDTSKPLLEALRKAASQLTRQRAGFIAVQFQEIAAADLMLPHLRRRAGILSYALFGQYGATHVNGTYFCGFSAAVIRGAQLGIPAFFIPNSEPKFPCNRHDASPFLDHVSDADFATAIGAPRPATSISSLPV